MNEYGKRVAKKMEDYMGDPNSVSKEINDIQNAIEGVEVRGALAAGVAKSFNKSKNAEEKAEEAHEITQDLLDETFDSAALEANFEQRLDEAIENLQPEWSQFKDNTVAQLSKIEQEKAGMVKSDLVFTIGQSGDFATLNQALEYISRLKNTHKNGGYNVELKYLSGYVVLEQTFIKNIDLSYITLTSEDDEVLVDISGNIIRAFNAKAPNINVLYDMQNKGSTGLHLEAGSNIVVYEDCGVKNAGQHGIHFIDSIGTINKSIFTGANINGIRVTQGSQVTAMGADASRAGEDGFFISRLSAVHANEADGGRKTRATNCGRWGVRCGYAFGAFRGAVLTHNERGICAFSGAVVMADGGVDCSHSGVDGILSADGAVVHAPETTITDCGENGLYARYGGQIIATDSVVTNCKHGVFARHGATIIFDRSIANDNSARGLIARDSSIISALNVETKTNSTAYSVFVQDGSSVNLKNGRVGRLFVTGGSSANADGANCRMIEAYDGVELIDITVERGSTINAFDSLGSLSQEENKLTRNGVIYR